MWEFILLWIEQIGWIADVFFVGAFLGASRGWIAGEGRVFNGMNLVGGLLYGLYAWVRWTPPVLALETVWCGIALYSLIRPRKSETAVIAEP